MGKIRQEPDVKENDPQTYAIIGAAMEVHKHLGPGFLETVYQDALEIELTERAVPFEREKKLTIFYRGKALPSRYQADFVGFGDIIDRQLHNSIACCFGRYGYGCSSSDLYTHAQHRITQNYYPNLYPYKHAYPYTYSHLDSTTYIVGTRKTCKYTRTAGN